MPEELMGWLREFAFGFAGKAIGVMLLVAICGLIIWFISQRRK